MALRQWSRQRLIAIWLLWPLVVFAVAFGPALVALARRRPRGTWFLVVAPSSWTVLGIAILCPLIAVTWLWRRAHALR